VNRRAARIVAAALIAGGCRSAGAPARPPAFLIDPRTGLEGPFPEAVGRGWEKILSRDWEEALRLFSRPHGPASSIGAIEALLGLGRLDEAGRACDAVLSQGSETAPALAACAEVAARRGDWAQAYDLFEAVVLRVPSSEGLIERRDAAAVKAVEALIEKARLETAQHPADAQAEAERALEIAPGNREAMVPAGRAAAGAGDAPAAFARLYAAWKLDPSDASVGEQAGELARKIGRGDAAFEIFSALARNDPRFRARAQESEEEFVISNWPAAEREIAHAQRLTRAGGVTLLWKLLPQIRSASPTDRAPVASDIVSRKDQRILARALQLGLISVDPATHRARPDGVLSRVDAVRMLLRAGSLAGSRAGDACVSPGARVADVLPAAARCGLLPASRRNGVSGAEFRRAISFLEGRRIPEGNAA
jgi:tetratricopeptide (TPR) repeat protein